MPQINLLPWREERRQRRQKEFGSMAFGAVVLMLGVVGGVHWYNQGRIDYQFERNTFLESEIQKLETQISEIKELKKQRERLIARTQKIQQLQSGRPDIVHMVDELVTTLPEGVYYTRIQQRGNSLTLEGVAQSNARVSSLMRSLDASDWLENPGLKVIRANADGGAAGNDVRTSTFQLNVIQTTTKPKASDEDDGQSG